MVIAASNILVVLLPVIGAVAALAILIGSLVYARAFVKKNEFQGLIDQKNAAIESYKQAHEGFEARIQGLEHKLAEVIRNAEIAAKTIDELNVVIENLKKELEKQITRYGELQRYAAPQGFKAIMDQLILHQKLIMHVIEKVDENANDDGKYDAG